MANTASPGQRAAWRMRSKDCPELVADLLNRAFASYSGHLIRIGNGQWKYTRREQLRLAKRLFSTDRKKSQTNNSRFKSVSGTSPQRRRLQAVRRRLWATTSTFQLWPAERRRGRRRLVSSSFWTVEQVPSSLRKTAPFPVVVAPRAVCTQDDFADDNRDTERRESQWKLNADMLVATGSSIEWGRSLLSDAERLVLFPSRETAPAGGAQSKRELIKNRQVVERANFLVARYLRLPRKQQGRILLLDGVLWPTVTQFLRAGIPRDKIIVADCNTQHLVHHEACRALLCGGPEETKIEVWRGDLNDVLLHPPRHGVRKEQHRDITLFYADFCGDVHPNLSEWVTHLPDLRILAVTQAKRLPADRKQQVEKAQTTGYGSLKHCVRVFDCSQVRCFVFSREKK